MPNCDIIFTSLTSAAASVDAASVSAAASAPRMLLRFIVPSGCGCCCLLGNACEREASAERAGGRPAHDLGRESGVDAPVAELLGAEDRDERGYIVLDAFDAEHLQRSNEPIDRRRARLGTCDHLREQGIVMRRHVASFRIAGLH